MPDSIGALRKVGQRLLTPSDTLWRYADGRAQISVIRYPIGPNVKVGADTAQWLEREGGAFLAVMPILQRRGEIESYSVRLAQVQPGPNPPALEHLGIVLNVARGKRTIETQYLYVIGGRFLKIRVTEPDDSAASPVQAFARTLAKRIAAASQ